MLLKFAYLRLSIISPTLNAGQEPERDGVYRDINKHNHQQQPYGLSSWIALDQRIEFRHSNSQHHCLGKLLESCHGVGRGYGDIRSAPGILRCRTSSNEEKSFEYEDIQSLEMAAQISVACASEFLRNPSMINFVADTDRSACQSRLLLQTNSDMSR